MKKMLFSALLLCSLGTLYSCFTNPVTGRKTLNLADEASMRTAAAAEYQKVLATSRPITGTPDAEMVKRIGARMQVAVQQYLATINKTDLVSGYQWEFNLINNKEANAWCMPGGKVAVYTGILPYTQTETGLAVVMGHEIAHAVARHSNERATDVMLTQYGGQALSGLLGTNSSGAGEVINAAIGIGGTGLLLKFSRNQESEADEMGLYFMAMAGYNPEEAVNFWQRMGSGGGGKPPEILSTHPSDQTRINDIKRLLPKAKQYYKPQ